MSVFIFSTHLHFFLQSDVVISSIMAYTYLSRAPKLSLANRSHKLIYCKTVVTLCAPLTIRIMPTGHSKGVRTDSMSLKYY